MPAPPAAALLATIFAFPASAAPPTPPTPPTPPGTSDASRVVALDRFTAGRAALASRRFEDAEQEFFAAIRLFPGLAVAHYGLGQALMGQSKFPEAADAFLSCRNVFSMARRADNPKAREMEIRDLRDTIQALASRHAISGDRFLEMQLEKRLADLQRGGAVAPFVPFGVTMALGSAYFQAGALEEAEREFRAVLKEDPGSGDAENNLALVLTAMGRLDEAEAAIQRAEKAGVKVSPRVREDIQRRRASPSPP